MVIGGQFASNALRDSADGEIQLQPVPKIVLRGQHIVLAFDSPGTPGNCSHPQRASVLSGKISSAKTVRVGHSTGGCEIA